MRRVTYLQSLGTYFFCSASAGTDTPTNASAPLAKHFHCTTPSTTPLVVVGAGKAESVVPFLVYGTSNKLPPPAAAVVVMVMMMVVMVVMVVIV